MSKGKKYTCLDVRSSLASVAILFLRCSSEFRNMIKLFYSILFIHISVEKLKLIVHFQDETRRCAQRRHLFPSMNIACDTRATRADTLILYCVEVACVLGALSEAGLPPASAL